MGTFTLMLNGCGVDDQLLADRGTLEVEENADGPGAVQLSLPADSAGQGEPLYVNDARFQPFASVAVVVQPAGSAAHCIFDGFILSSKLQLKIGTGGSTLQVWGQDASWLMHLEEKTVEWINQSDGDVANAIFQLPQYDFQPADDNAQDESPTHPENGHSLMQRGSDIQFLRSLARRTGKLCRVFCRDKPGVRTGYFAKPNVQGHPDVTLDLQDPNNWTTGALDLSWDVTNPSSVLARQASFTDSDPDGFSADDTNSGLDLLSRRGLAAFAGRPMSVLLAASVDDVNDLRLRARSVLRDAGWFARCEGEADAARLQAVLRAGTVVRVTGAGVLNSGRYFVWSVRHTITRQSHRMKFVLVRNAVGAPVTSMTGPVGGLP